MCKPTFDFLMHHKYKLIVHIHTKHKIQNIILKLEYISKKQDKHLIKTFKSNIVIEISM